MLKLLGHKMGNFKLTILCQRQRSNGKFREFEAGREFLLKQNGDNE